MSIFQNIQNNLSSLFQNKPKEQIKQEYQYPVTYFESGDAWAGNNNLAFDKIKSSKAYQYANEQAFKNVEARIVTQVPNFGMYKNIYYAIPEVQSVVTKLTDRLMSNGTDLVDLKGNQNDQLQAYLESKYNLRYIAKQLAIQKLIYGNALTFVTGYKKDQITVLDSFIVPPMNECQVFLIEKASLKMKSFYWINPTLGSKFIDDDFYFNKNESVGNVFFGDSPLASLELASGILNSDAKNYNEYFENGSFPGIMFLFDKPITEDQKLKVKAGLEQWKSSNSRYRGGVFDNMEGVKIEQRKPEMGVLDVAQREYIWKTIINSYHIPSDFVLRQGGLGAGEQKTMLENLKYDAIIPLATFVEDIINNFVLHQIFKYDGKATELNKGKEFYNYKFNEINTESPLEKSQRLLSEVQQAQRPLKDYYTEMYPNMLNNELYKHWDSYVIPSNIVVQPIGKTIETKIEDGLVTEEKTEVTTDKNDLVQEHKQQIQIPTQSNKAILENPISISFNFKTLVEDQPLDISELQKKKIAGQTKNRVKFFSQKAMSEGVEVSPVPALKNKQEFKQIQDIVAKRLYNQYKNTVLPILKNNKIQSKKADLTDQDQAEIDKEVKEKTDKLNLSDILTLLYIVSMFGRENAMRYVRDGNQPDLTPDERVLIEQQVKSYIANRIGTETQKQVLAPLESKLQALLKGDLKQYDFTDFNLNITSQDDIASIVKQAISNNLSEAEVLALIKKKTLARAELITTQEVNTLFGLTEALVYDVRKPTTKTKLPTTSKDPREIHTVLNFKTIPYNQFWDEGSFTFPNPYYFHCQCSQKVSYEPTKETTN